jgi:hypothetical protein
MEVKNVFITSNILPSRNANAYTVYIPNVIKDIYRVEVTYATYNLPVSTPFVYLDIQELRSPLFNMTAIANPSSYTSSITASQNLSESAFAVLPGGSSGQTFYNNASNYSIVVDYPFPIQKLDRLTVSWHSEAGPVPFPLDSETAVLLKMYTLRKNMGPFQ